MLYNTRDHPFTTLQRKQDVGPSRPPKLESSVVAAAAPEEPASALCLCCATCELPTDLDGPSPEAVIEASRSGNLHHMRHALCQLRGGIINCADEDGMTALHVAAQKGHLPIVKLLLSETCTPQETQVVRDEDRQPEVNNREVIKPPPRRDAVKLQSPGDSCHPTTPSTEDSEKWALSSTTGSSVTSSELKSSLIKTNSNIEDESPQIFPEERNASGEATSVNDQSKYGASSVWASRRTLRGHTALHWAAIKGHYTCAAELLSFGFEVDAKSNQNATPLHLAVTAERLDIVKLLVNAGADVNSTTLTGSSPLIAARHRGNVSVVEVLSPSSNINNYN